MVLDRAAPQIDLASYAVVTEAYVHGKNGPEDVSYPTVTRSSCSAYAKGIE